jgi:three-Cys-motif partner protein
VGEIMPPDPYIWAKGRIKNLVEKIDILKTDGLLTAPGQIWSIKKLLALDYYIASTHVIFKKYFNNWYYVDTHCGSGLIGFNDDVLKLERFPGSPLIATLRNSKNPFTDYLLSDLDQNSVSALKTRLVKIKPLVGNKSYDIQTRSFAGSVSEIKKYEKWGNAFLIFIDPVGYTELEWDLMKQLLSIEKADIFLTFMSYSIALNRKNALPGTESEKTFDLVYGTQDWRQVEGQEDLLEVYLKQIRTLKKNVSVIPVFRTGENKLYDLIFATNSDGAGDIMDYIKKLMTLVTTELIESALQVATKKSKDLTEFF